MSAVKATALVVAGGFHCWEPGVYDPDTRLFAYQAWVDNQPVARVIGATPGEHGQYIDIKIEGSTTPWTPSPKASTSAPPKASSATRSPPDGRSSTPTTPPTRNRGGA